MLKNLVLLWAGGGACFSFVFVSLDLDLSDQLIFVSFLLSSDRSIESMCTESTRHPA